MQNSIEAEKFATVLFSGIGIDDMFVILQCWNNLNRDLPQDENGRLEVAERIGLTMKHAGIAITVTSLTDAFAFGVGAVTVTQTLAPHSKPIRARPRSKNNSLLDPRSCPAFRCFA